MNHRVDETPRTDKATDCPELWEARQSLRNGNQPQMVVAVFARTLERELNIAIEKADLFEQGQAQDKIVIDELRNELNALRAGVEGLANKYDANYVEECRRFSEELRRLLDGTK